MVSYNIVKEANKALITSQPLVAIFVGATWGIGELSVRALARHHGTVGKGLRIYLVGRTQKNAEETIKECQSLCPTGDFEYIKADDLSLIKDVNRVSEKIIEREKEKSAAKGDRARIDMLVMTQGYVNFGGRQDTSEGLEVSMTLLYYGRMKFIINLMPLLEESILPAHIISIYAAGFEKQLFSDDLSLRQAGHYGFGNCRSHCVYMKTLFMEKLAREHVGKFVFVHQYPGLVFGKGFERQLSETWMRLLLTVLRPILKATYVTPEGEAGDRVLFLATNYFPAQTAGKLDVKQEQVPVGTDGKLGSGSYAVGRKDDASARLKPYEKFGRQSLEEKVWAHTMKAFEEIDAGKVFAD